MRDTSSELRREPKLHGILEDIHIIVTHNGSASLLSHFGKEACHGPLPQAFRRHQCRALCCRSLAQESTLLIHIDNRERAPVIPGRAGSPAHPETTATKPSPQSYFRHSPPRHRSASITSFANETYLIPQRRRFLFGARTTLFNISLL